MASTEHTINGRTYYLSERPISLYDNLPEFLEYGRLRLLRNDEIRKLIADGFPFNELDFVGEFWTSTKVSCSLMLIYRVKDDGSVVVDKWDKTFRAWGLAVVK